jgi:aminopeptidase N
VFLAAVEGRSYGKVVLAIDPLGISNLSSRLTPLTTGEEVMLSSTDDRKGGIWYLSTYAKEAVSGRSKAMRPLVDGIRYDIDTTIDGNTLRGVTTMTVTPLVAGLRVLPIQIDNTLRISSAALEQDGGVTPLPIVRDELVVGGTRVPDADVAIVFPRPLALQQPVRVRVEYDGDNVLDGVGGRYAVRARSSWYANVGTFSDLAMYELTFRFPKRNTLVSVGHQVSERIEGGQKITVWKSDVPIRVAGFNYGEFEKLTIKDNDTGIAVAVYTNRDWSAQAKIAQADAMNASRVATAYFGKQPFTEISITQQVQDYAGQSWPSLVFLASAALTSSTSRAMSSNLDPRSQLRAEEFINVVGWHEVSHQWWGHQVGWQSYRDQWLSEGFAEFTAALTLEAVQGRRDYDRFWAIRRTEILDKPKDVANVDAGGITQGYRLATERSPQAARYLIYPKGAYVLHMLRMMMREDGKDPDRIFRTMMTDFVTTWAGKSPSTDDFQRIAEKYMTPLMDLAGTHTLDYFFEQWVHNTDLPTLSSTLQLQDLGGGKYRITGTVSQSAVPAGFHTLVPVYLDFGDDKLQKLGTIHLNGLQTQNVSADVALPQKPKKVLINARNDVLAR